jgi:hydroxyacylglutathione hydrolase
LNLRAVIILSLVIITIGCKGIHTTKSMNNTIVHTLYSTTSNVHLVIHNGIYFLIDAGVDGDESKIENHLEALDIRPEQISFLVITHGHPDHSGTAAYFKEKYGIKVIAGQGDQHIINSGKLDKLCSTSALGDLVYYAVPKEFKAFNADVFINEETSLIEYGIDGTIFPITSHTEGSRAIVVDGHAFVGDIIRGKAMAKRTPALHFYQCDMTRNEEVINEVLTWSCETWYPGHFGPLKPVRIKKWLESQPFK